MQQPRTHHYNTQAFIFTQLLALKSAKILEGEPAQKTPAFEQTEKKSISKKTEAELRVMRPLLVTAGL